MKYAELIKEYKNETDFENLQKEMNSVETIINKCLKFICECTGTTAERDYNVKPL